MGMRADNGCLPIANGERRFERAWHRPFASKITLNNANQKMSWSEMSCSGGCGILAWLYFLVPEDGQPLQE